MPRRPARLAALLLLLLPVPDARAQDVPPGWRGTWDFMVQTVCADAEGRILPGATPLDGPAACPHPRKLRPGEPLPYHKRDWPDAADRDRKPGGYQQSDSVPVQTTLGPAALQTFDFGDNGDGPRRFNAFDPGDGGQLVVLTPATASVAVTQDGGAGLQLFLGPACAPSDGWVLVDAGFPASPAGETLARITRQPDRCPSHLGYAWTRWQRRPLPFRHANRGRPGDTVLDTLVTDHFGGRTPDAAPNLERMYFTRELGLTRWERWENLSRNDNPEARRMAAHIAASGRCAPGLGTPSATAEWAMTDCREWTRLVPPGDPAGDPPTFWLDRLRADPRTRALFPAPLTPQ